MTSEEEKRREEENRRFLKRLIDSEAETRADAPVDAEDDEAVDPLALLRHVIVRDESLRDLRVGLEHRLAQLRAAGVPGANVGAAPAGQNVIVMVDTAPAWASGSGSSNVPRDPADYAEFMQGLGGIKWAARLGLVTILALHVATAIVLFKRTDKYFADVI